MSLLVCPDYRNLCWGAMVSLCHCPRPAVRTLSECCLNLSFIHSSESRGVRQRATAAAHLGGGAVLCVPALGKGQLPQSLLDSCVTARMLTADQLLGFLRDTAWPCQLPDERA